MTDKSVEKWPSWCSVLSGGAKQKSARNVVSVGSLCNNDYDGNESVQKVTGLISKTTIMHALVTSLFHCCRSMTKTWNVLTRRFRQPEKTVDILRRHHWFPRENDVWATSVEIPFWWRVTTHIWALLLIGRKNFSRSTTNQRRYVYPSECAKYRLTLSSSPVA